MPIAKRIRCGSIRCVRTTLDIDEDVLSAAKELAAQENSTAGKMLSEYFRRGLQAALLPVGKGRRFAVKNGIPVLPARAELVTTEHIRKLMEEEGI